MSAFSAPVEELLEAALEGEFTVVDASGRPATHPPIPLYAGARGPRNSTPRFCC